MSCRRRVRRVAASILGSVLSVSSIKACDLCAIYGATSDRGTASGPVFILAEQYISEHTLQYNSDEIVVPDAEFLESSITHIIGGYNFNRDIGVNLNIPIERHKFRIYDPLGGNFSEGISQGLGDISLIGRWTPYTHETMSKSFRVNLLAGITLPTGDDEFVRKDVEQHAALDAIYGVGHDHAFSAVHLHDLALGSGSVDAVFGITANGRYKRGFFTLEAQYYLRTEGEADFEFGDTLMISGGPGAYLLLQKNLTLSIQGVVRYEDTRRSSYSGEDSNQTGMREIYAGPQLTMSIGRHFSAQAGGDIPIDIRNNGFQVVPDYRVHGSLTWSF
jgi:hypothetical protein